MDGKWHFYRGKKCLNKQWLETQHMVNFGQKTAIFNLWNSRQKKIPPNWLETTLVSQKKTNLNFETTLVSQKKTIFKNTNVNRHVESAESTNSGQRRRPFWERKRVNVDQRCQQELVKWKIASRTRKNGLFSNFFCRKFAKIQLFFVFAKRPS